MSRPAPRVPIAWLQLAHEKIRLAVGVAGVAFAVVLVFMQLGFQGAMYESATRYHRALDFDLVMLSPKTPFIGFPKPFSRRRLYQALGSEAVTQVSPLYIQQASWKNPWQHNVRNILLMGLDPSRPSFLDPELLAKLPRVRRTDVLLFDTLSRPEYGPVATHAARGPLATELNDRRISVEGLFELGTSFGIDGSVITSDVNFRRLVPRRPEGQIDVGLIHLEPGRDASRVRDALVRSLEPDVLVMTRPEFIEREVGYWSSTTPIGFVFGFGSVMGLIVGSVIVYQILFADVSQHLREYATLKAMGYSDGFLRGIVLQEALILSTLGFLPGLAATAGLYEITVQATQLPIELTWERSLLVLALTFTMCGMAAVIALRKVRSADPAEVFG